MEYNPDGTVKSWKIKETTPNGDIKEYQNKEVPDLSDIPQYEPGPFFTMTIPEPPPPPPRDQLVLDLGGNGIITTGLTAGIHFDHDGDGFRELSGFVNSEDGLLVLDRNGDGKINDGGELFGDSTRFLNGEIAPHGFAALSEFDDDKDGVINKDDAIFDKLRIFQDLNQNGKTDAGELFSLEEKKIAGLNLTYQNSPFIDKFGNAHRQLGTYVTESGETRTLTDVAFITNRTLTETDMLVVPTNIAVLPNAVGFGTTYSLHQAIVRDESGRLKELVQDFVACTDRTDRLALTKNILFAWTGQDKVLATELAKKIKVLNSFLGTDRSNDWPRAMNRFDQMTDSVYFQLMRTTHLQPLFDKISYSLNSAANTYVGHFDNALSVLATTVERTPQTGHDLVLDFVQAVRGINPYNSLNQNAFRSEVRTWLINRDQAVTYSAETLGLMSSLAAGATDLADTVTGSEQGELHYGFSGNDTILGMAGDDVLVGCQSNDLIEGGTGNDIYRFARGFGKDRINNLDTAVGRCDVIEFTGDIKADELLFSRAGNDLLIDLGTSGDQIRINSHFYQDSTGGYAVDSIGFADGTTMDISGSGFTVLNTLAMHITETGDELHGTLGDDVIDGLGGNDTMFGKEGADTLKGSTGHDTIIGDGGDDILYGDEGHYKMLVANCPGICQM